MSSYDFEQFKQDFLGGIGSAADAVADVARDTGSSVGRYKDFLSVGSEVAKLNNTSHGGNISLSDGLHIWITRTGARLARLTPGDIVRCSWEPDTNDAEASMELLVHRAIYHQLASKAAWAGEQFTQAAIIHAHCLYTNYQSLISSLIDPPDSESKFLIGSVDVIECEQSIASQEVADKMVELVKVDKNIGVVRGHGSFVIGKNLDQALQHISSLEYSAHLLTLLNKKS